MKFMTFLKDVGLSILFPIGIFIFIVIIIIKKNNIH